MRYAKGSREGRAGEFVLCWTTGEELLVGLDDGRGAPEVV